ncbi:non-ribosomal peptide synthetase [Aquimarina spongiae]|uniref:Amino acid adenylation domain-containing protein n=1 Tax=Aquimarina spongiae TaxID=570521 RepID=A0A1M6LJK0_9FLAO|nr:non-ribosomal peptide synthetase [Aquimarina spongiae]SHJ71364.1 amino acid adenylation domain-containing protein [Aquimarina spongiae]
MVFQEELIKSLIRAKENIAIEYNQHSITYEQILRTSNKITKFLLDQGLSRETFVGVLMDDKVDLICSMIGIMNARCVFVPIDSKLPKDRLDKIVEEMKLEYLITSNTSNATLENVKNQYNLQHILRNDDVDLEYPKFEKDDSLYVYFTSGSTGTPKGIIGKNCSLIQFLQWQISEFEINDTCRVSQLISPYFDAFLRDVFIPLLTGGTVCIPFEEEDFFTPEKITQWIDQNEISMIHCVPSVFRIFGQHPRLGDHAFKNLKHIFLSGEKIIPTELRKWYDCFGNTIQLVNFYGATETTMIRSFYRIRPEDSSKQRIPIGAPIADTEILILDNEKKPVKALMTGDLYIVTDYMSKGYLNNVSLTNEKFIALNQDTDQEKIAFKTGDKGRVLPNNVIELLGREDRQVKLRGIRVELDEIENVLLKSNLIKNIVVVKKEENPGSDKAQNNGAGFTESLVAFVVEAEEGVSKKIDQYAQEYLPAYMLPSRYVAVKEFPLLSNGKIDLKKLETLMDSDTSEVVRPRNDIEEKLLAIWEEILGKQSISVVDSFQRMGGNSLSIMRLIAKIYTEFKVRISLSQLFKTLTIESQASFIQNATKDNIFKISKMEQKPFYPLSSSQKRMYFNYDLNREDTSYNLPIVFQMEDNVDLSKVESSFNKLIERHESLRTVFSFKNENIVQEIKETDKVKIAAITSNNMDQSIQDFIKPFDLNHGPLYRLGVITSNENERFLIFDIHHIICDGISQVNLFKDFLTLYYDQSLEKLTLQYSDYAEWENEFITNQEYIQQREFWLKAFEKDIPRLELPTSNDDEEFDTEGGSTSFAIANSQLKPLIHNVKEGDKITDFSVLYSLFVTFLVQLTGQEDIVVGIASSGRIQEEVEQIVGMFSKTLPIRSKLDTKNTFREITKDISAYLVEATSKQTYDLSDILMELNKKTENHIKHLFDVMFIYQNFDKKKLNDFAKDFTYFDFENKTAKYPLSLFINEEENEYRFTFEYASSVFTASDIDIIASQFRDFMTSILESVDTAIMDVIGGDHNTLESVEDDLTFNF